MELVESVIQYFVISRLLLYKLLRNTVVNEPGFIKLVHKISIVLVVSNYYIIRLNVAVDEPKVMHSLKLVDELDAYFARRLYGHAVVYIISDKVVEIFSVSLEHDVVPFFRCYS